MIHGARADGFNKCLIGVFSLLCVAVLRFFHEVLLEDFLFFIQSFLQLFCINFADIFGVVLGFSVENVQLFKVIGQFKIRLILAVIVFQDIVVVLRAVNEPPLQTFLNAFYF